MLRKIIKILAVFSLVILIVSGFNNVYAMEQDQLLRIVRENVEVKLQPSADAEVLIVDDSIQFFKKGNIYRAIQEVPVYEQLEENEEQTDQNEQPQPQIIDLWYQVEFIRDDVSYMVYVNKDDVELLDMEFEREMQNQKFPQDYVELLRELHSLHPDWHFEAFHTDIEWTTMLDKEDVLRKNLISGSNVNLRSTAEGAYDPIKKKFIPLDGTSWYQANRETIAYYIDPRNFINETNIFMFLKLSFNESESQQLVQKILDNTFMSGNDPVDGIAYSQIFYDAGKNNDVSPIYLATQAKQEQGVNGSSAVTGGSFTYNGKTYKGLYNFFNIGATSGADNWKKGLVYANGGEDGQSTSYNRPWTSPVKSITGGAMWIVKGYISKGQDTMYTQKFNCTSYSTFSHQYMTNVQASYSQSKIMFNTYSKNDCLDTVLTFKIPVYLNMPEKTELPTSITYPGEPEEPDPVQYSGDIIIDLDLLNVDGYLTGFNISMNYDEFKSKVALINKDLAVRIEKNGSEIAGNDLLASGEKLYFTDSNGTSTYTIIIRGDLNGDGKIDTKDYLIYRKALLGIYQMNAVELKAAAVSGSEEISTKGYLAIRKYLLGIADIKQ